MSYKAFISYSHSADGKLAPALQSGLQKFAKPFYRLRALRIFRDETSLHLTDKLWPLIQQSLKESEHFILMASPTSADSEWVRKEVGEWLTIRNGSLDKFFIVLTEGTIFWDESINDFNWQKTTALPKNLQGKFKTEPLFLDFCWARESDHLSLRDPKFLKAIAKLAAALHNKHLDILIGEDVRQHRIFKIVTTLILILLLMLTAVASGAAYYANEQRKEAINQRNEAERQKRNAETERANAVAAAEKERAAREAEKRERERAEKASENERTARKVAERRRAEADAQRRVAQSRQLLAEAELTRFEAAGNSGLWADLRQRSFLLTVAAADQVRSKQTLQMAAFDRAVRSVARTIPRSEKVVQLESEPDWLSYTADGKLLVIGFDDRTIVRDARSGKELGRLPAFERENSWTPTLSYFAKYTDEDHFRVWRIGENVEEVKGLRQDRVVTGSAIGRDGRLLATAGEDKVLRIFNTADGKELITVPQPENIEQITIDSTRERIAIASGDESIRIYTPRSATPTNTLTTRSAEDLEGIRLNYVALSPDGALVAGANYTTVVVWDLCSGRELKRIRVLPDAEDEGIMQLGFGSNSRSVSVMTDEGDAALYDTGTGQKLWPMLTASDWWTENFGMNKWSAFGPDSARLIPGGIEIWDRSEGQRMASVEHTGDTDAVAYNVATHTVAIAEGAKLRFVDLNSGDDLAGAALPGETEVFVSSAGGETFAVKTETQFGIWNWAMTSWWTPEPAPRNPAAFAVNGDGSRVALWSDDGLMQWSVDKATGEVKLLPMVRFDSENGILPAKPEGVSWEVTLEYSKSGHHLSALANGRWYVWEMSSGRQIAQGQAEGLGNAISFDADEKAIWYISSHEGTSALWSQDLLAGTNERTVPRRVMPMPDGIHKFFSPEGRYVFIRDFRNSKASLWDTRARGLALEIPFDSTKEISFGAHDRFLAVVDAKSIPASETSSILTVYDLNSRRVVTKVKHARNVHNVIFSNDGTVMASADYGTSLTDPSAVQLTDLRTGKELGRLNMVGPVYGVAIKDDRRRVCIYGKTGVARVWDISNHKQPMEIAQLYHNRRLRWAAFDSDSGYLKTIDGDHSATGTHKWIISEEELLSRVRAGIRRNFTPEERKNFLQR